MDEKHLALAGIGAGIVVIVLYLASQSTGDSLVGVPSVQTEAQFNAYGVDLNAGMGVGTPLDMSPSIHFYDEGWNCPDQQSVQSRHRYPVVSGGNITTVIHRGMASLINGSPDNAWRTTPPSEESL